jgi:outer membrane protein OmpA-like peptidoglycan-associated protein
MKKILLVAALATFSLNALAQGGDRGPFLTNKARDNWFISAGGGVNIYYGENDKLGSFGKRMAPALDISLGKWFTPAVGARLQYSGLKAKGWTNSLNAPFIASGVYNLNQYAEKFNVSFFHADVLWNLSSALGGYKPERRWEFVPFAGFGGAKAKANGIRNRELALTAGLINKIRLSAPLDLKLELRGMLVNQRFDGTVGGRSGEGMFSATLGLSYKLGKRTFDVPEVITPVDLSAYTARIGMLESDLEVALAKADQYVRDLEAAKNHKPVAQAKTEYVIPQMAVFFRIGRYALTEQEKINIGYIADALKQMPADRKFKLVGNADSTTGSAKRNQTLSEQRAKVVYDALVAAGVKPSQLEIIAHGDRQEPFPHNQPRLNRVLIIE